MDFFPKQAAGFFTLSVVVFEVKDIAQAVFLVSDGFQKDV